MRAVFRVTALAARLLAVAVLVGACGAPPEPLPTAPPEAVGSGGPASDYPSAAPTVYPVPSGGVPVGGYPTPGLPMYPTPGLPMYPTPTLPTVRPAPTTPRPSTAPRSTHGPSAAQVIAVVRTRPGIPTDPSLDVKRGPFCAGTWQFTVLGEVGKTLDEVDPLLVVTTGRPSALTVVEAGADVCSSHVEEDAPSGIRVLACGS
jgi:hypothetical protein